MSGPSPSNPPPILTRKPTFQRILSRTATITQNFTSDVSEAVTFLTEAGVEAALEAQQDEQLGVKLESAPDTPTAVPETPAQVTKRHEVTEALGEGFLDPSRIIFRDKVVFFIGVLNVALIAFWIGAQPGTYYHFWTAKCAVLFPLRWWSYKQRNMHYMLLELCYFGNFIGIAQAYMYPYSPLLRKLSFAFAAGPLMFSILAMRNSLVFHDFDKTTTLMMHASPAIALYTMRWFPSAAWTAGLPADVAPAFETSTWTELLLAPWGLYLVWVVAYYLVTFVVLYNRIVQKGRMTMFSLMIPKNPKGGKVGGMAKFVLSFRESLQPIVYLGCHGIAASLAFLPVKFLYDHFWLHTATLMWLLGLSVWNGGNFYFKVFARKYMAQLQEEATARAQAAAAKKAKAT
jgi:hypothetical protein